MSGMFGYVGYRISSQRRMQNVKDIYPNTGYQITGQIPGRIADISAKIWSDSRNLGKYPAGYQISGRIPNIWSDTKYLGGQISGQTADISACYIYPVGRKSVQAGCYI